MLKFKEFSLIKPDEIQTEQISKVIEENNGSVFHEVGLNEIVASQFNTDLFYLVDDPNDISVLSPVHKEHLGLGLERYHLKPLYDIPYGGFVGEHDSDYYNFSIGAFESIRYVGFPYKKDFNVDSTNFRIRETAMVDLSLDEDEIFTKVINSKRRNRIRKALKEGVVVESYFSTEGLRKFWPLLKQMHDKLGYNNLSFDYYNKILNKYGYTKQSFVLVAYINYEVVSGLFFVGNKNYMHCYKAASSYEHKDEGQGELLHWEAIKLSKSLEAKYYDLCGLNKNELPEIYRFKTSISKEIFNYPVYSKNSMGFKIVNRIKSLF